MLFQIARGVRFIWRKITAFYWQKYHSYYCRSNNVIFSDRKSVRFFGKALISISPKSVVKIGKAFIDNSGPDYGIGTTTSKITVRSGAQLEIGDYTGVSSTTLLVSKSIKIGNYVNMGGVHI